MLKELQQHKRLLSYLPDFLKEYREYQVITSLAQVEFDAIMERIDTLLSDLFVDTATLSGIERREKMYGVIPLEGATLEERRLAVKMKELISLPFTFRQYREILYDLCGAENTEITLKPDVYYLGVRIRAVLPTGEENLAVLRSAKLISKQMVPANMVCIVTLFDHFEPEHTLYTAGTFSMMRSYQIQMSPFQKTEETEQTIHSGGSFTMSVKQPIKEA